VYISVRSYAVVDFVKSHTRSNRNKTRFMCAALPFGDVYGIQFICKKKKNDFIKYLIFTINGSLDFFNCSPSQQHRAFPHEWFSCHRSISEAKDSPGIFWKIMSKRYEWTHTQGILYRSAFDSRVQFTRVLAKIVWSSSCRNVYV
jgi:hypothetical protein